VIRIVGAFIILTAMASIAASANASLYQPDEPMVVPVKSDGVAEALSFDEFRSHFLTLTNQANSTMKTTDRERLLKRVAEDRARINAAAPDDRAAYAVDLLRLGKLDEAVNLLKPLYDDRDRRGTRTYAVVAVLIHAHALRGEWDQALNYMLDLDNPPSKVKGWSDTQRVWLLHCDDTILPHYLAIRRAESDIRAKEKQEEEEPTPLFPLPSKGKPAAPVRFVNEAGVYEPAALAKAERDKLPPDAVAIVQQLLLWFPGDTRLYWLLAELYAADGQLDEAQTIFDQCAGPRQFSARRHLMEHRTAVTAAIEEHRKAAEQAAANAFPVSLRAIAAYFGAVMLIGIIAVLRIFTRRRKAGFWPGCCG
jgi:tetratricopeptide (TPR) repeat protein